MVRGRKSCVLQPNGSAYPIGCRRDTTRCLWLRPNFRRCAAKSPSSKPRLRICARKPVARSRGFVGSSSALQFAANQVAQAEEALLAAAREKDELATTLAACMRASHDNVAAHNARIRELETALDDKTADNVRLVDDLARAKAEIRGVEKTAANRVAAFEAIHAAALTESENRTPANLRALQDQIVDAEGTLAKTGRERSRASWAGPFCKSRRAARALAKSGLFDAAWYLREYPDVAASVLAPVVHYSEEGYLRGYRPNPLFDTRWYLGRYEDVRRASINPLVHYMKYCGIREGRYPHPLFNSQFYLKRNPDVAAAEMNPLMHYLAYGAAEHRDPHPLFDTKFFLTQKPDFGGAGTTPLMIYLSLKADDSVDPHPLFDSRYYARQLRYGLSGDESYLAHYVTKGASEGRSPHPLFDPNYYLAQNPDVAKIKCDPLIHYVLNGAEECRDPNQFFDVDWYLDKYRDVRAAGINPLVHYIQYGATEGRDPSPLFGSSWYLETNADVARARINPLVHFLEHGATEGRRPRPLSARLPLTPISAPDKIEAYSAWLACNEPNDRSMLTLQQSLGRFAKLPRISVIMPVYNAPPKILEETIESVVNQIYTDWELCIADDASTSKHVGRILKRWTDVDSRIRVVARDRNGGIAEATNSAAELATGEFLALLDHDDLLTPDALAEVGIYVADHEETDVLYSDDDKIDTAGRRFAPQFKPDWSPTLLLSYMYLGHLLVIRRDLFERIGGVRKGFDGSQDYDLALRAVEHARHVGHIPRVLYHWRVVTGSVAVSTEEKPQSVVAGLNAVASAFSRRGIDAKVERPSWAQAAKIGVYSATFPDTGPQVSILIPTRNKHDLLSRCLFSLASTTYKNYEIVIIDNESDDPEALAFLENCGHRISRVPRPQGKFSFAHVNNVAAQTITSKYVLFLNNDTEVISPRWLSQMMGYAQLPGVGAVGAKLLYRDGTVQHITEIVHGYHDGTAGHAFKNVSANNVGYLQFLKVTREM